MNYSNILRIKIKSVYVKDFLISTKVRLKRGEHLHGEEPISSEPTFSSLTHNKNRCCTKVLLPPKFSVGKSRLRLFESTLIERCKRSGSPHYRAQRDENFF